MNQIHLHAKARHPKTKTESKDVSKLLLNNNDILPPLTKNIKNPEDILKGNSNWKYVFQEAGILL